MKIIEISLNYLISSIKKKINSDINNKNIMEKTCKIIDLYHKKINGNKNKMEIQNNWNNIAKREYIAILAGILPDKKGILKDYLYEDKNHFVHVSKNKKGSLAITEYEVLNYYKNYTLVKINIKTGKKNQIRVSFANIGYPILGDIKYGSKNTRLYLHANRLSFSLNSKDFVFEAKLPIEFKKYI